MSIICRVVVRAVPSILVGYYLLNPATSCVILTSGAPSSEGLQYKGPGLQLSWPFIHSRIDVSTKQFISRVVLVPFKVKP